MRAMILAAGYGTRLWPLTEDRTKPAIPFMNRPLVGYVAEYLAQYDCREVLVNLHHRPDSVRAALGDGHRFGVNLTYVEEPDILGTSGALDNARQLLEADTFIVVNGKIVTDINLYDALATHRRTNALATLVLRPNLVRERFSMVGTRDGLITGFGGMPTSLASDNAGGKYTGANSDNEETVPLMFTGIQLLEPRIFSYIPRGVFSHSTTDVYPQAIARGERIAAHVAEGMWYELSTIERYLEISLALLRQKGTDVIAGAGSNISAGALVSESVLWENVHVEAGARVRRAILGDGVRIRAGEIIENAAVVCAALVRDVTPPAKALSGELRGDNFVVSLPE
ncbi:MAG: sugar phosphate nucleotidyltransferase [Pyrinomonadaceae bacterium]